MNEDNIFNLIKEKFPNRTDEQITKTRYTIGGLIGRYHDFWTEEDFNYWLDLCSRLNIEQPMYKIIILGKKWDEDEMYWNSTFRKDTILLAVTRRKLDICKELYKDKVNSISDCLYYMKEIESVFGRPRGYNIEKVKN